MYYTNVAKIGTKLMHRYIQDGKRHTETVNDFEYELFVKSHISRDSVDVYNNQLKRISIKNIEEFNQVVFEMGRENIYGNTDPVSQFIAKTYDKPVVLDNNYVVLAWDIETEHRDGFASPYIADREVILISMIDSTKNVCHVLGLKDYTGPTSYDGHKYEIDFVRCKNEKELLIKFIQIWREINPDIITGWNIEGYDIPYMVNRIALVLGRKFVNMLSPYSNYSNNCIRERQVEDELYYSIAGIAVYDYINIYKKFARNKHESYKLDFVAGFELDDAKVNYDEYQSHLMRLYDGDVTIYNDLEKNITEPQQLMKIAKDLQKIAGNPNAKPLDRDTLFKLRNMDSESLYQMYQDTDFSNHSSEDILYFANSFESRSRQESYNKFVKYGTIDSALILKMDAKLKFINLAITLAHITKSNLDDALGTVKPWDNIIYNRLLTKNTQIVPNIRKQKTKEFAGAFVKTPILGRHGWMVTTDLTSLYPSIIRSWYISPETLVDREVDNVDKLIIDLINGDIDTSSLVERNLTMAGNGSTYDKSIEGVIPEAMTYLFNYRVELKTEMKEKNKILQKKLEEIHELENMLKNAS